MRCDRNRSADLYPRQAILCSADKGRAESQHHLTGQTVQAAPVLTAAALLYDDSTRLTGEATRENGEKSNVRDSKFKLKFEIWT